MEFKKKLKVFNFLIMVKGPLNRIRNNTSLGERLWPVAWNQKFTSVKQGNKSKNAYKKRKNENFEKQKNAFFSHVTRIIQPKH